MEESRIEFIRAIPQNVDKLRILARNSEAHWNYNDTFMTRFDEIFNITKKFIIENPVYVAWIDDCPVAFWGLSCGMLGWELEYFYVSESYLINGYGKQMWYHMIRWCKDHSIHKISFVTSHQAVGFYKKMGAIQDTMVESIIDGREIPHFIYRV